MMTRSMVEVAIALVVLAIVSAAFFTAVGGSWSGILDEANRQMAVGCASRVLEELRAGLLSGELPAAEGPCGTEPGRGLWYRLWVRPDGAPPAGSEGETGGTPLQDTVAGASGGPGEPVLVTVAIYDHPAEQPGEPVYVVSSVFWPVAAGP